MVAEPARQLNEPRHQTYKDLLDGSVGIYVPSYAKSTTQEIGQKVKELKPPKIKEVLRDRRARLQKMIAYIDIEVSPRDLSRTFLIDMAADFNKQIHTVINKILEPENYIGNKQGISDNFKLVGPKLEAATSALKASNDAMGALHIKNGTITVDLREDGIFTLIQAMIEKNTHAYDSLREATEYLETGLSYWDKPGSRAGAEVADFEAYIAESLNKLGKQRETVEAIHDDLLYRDVDKPFGRPSLVKFERRLREEVLATLLPILQYEMHYDEALQNQIADSALGVYDAYKTDIIRSLRKARNALNLALDEYEYIKSPLVLTSEHLAPHLTAGIDELENAFKNWR